MKIQRLHINHFGKLKDRTLTFGDGIHLITGENESGKSTLHAFLKAMFFGIGRGRGRAAKNDDYNRYHPWEGGAYGGVLELEHDDCRYSIYRNFEKGREACRLADETHAREAAPTAANFSELLSGLTPGLYDNTLSISQRKAGTSKELADDLRNHIVNLHTSGSATLDVGGALQQLKIEKKKLESGFSKKADQETEELTLRIEALERDILQSSAAQEAARLSKEKEELEQKLLDLGARQQELAARIEQEEQILSRSSRRSAEEAEEIYEQAEKLADEYRSYEKTYQKPLSGALRPMMALLSVIFLIGFVFCFWQASLHLLQSGYRYAAAFAVLAILCGLVGLRINRRRDAAGSYRQVCRELTDLYEQSFGERPKKISRAQVDALLKTLRSYPRLRESLERSREELRADIADQQESQACLQDLSARLDAARRESWQSEQAEEALRTMLDRREALRGAVEKNRAIEEETKAIDLAMDTMADLSNQVFDSFGYFLETNTANFLSGITGGVYTGVSIGEDLSITLERNHVQVPLSRVSGGTIDQVYLALRLACIEFLWPEESMPLFLDDSFAYYDRDRLAATLSWLAENYPGQIFLMTCHTREKEILDGLQIPYQEIQL